MVIRRSPVASSQTIAIILRFDETRASEFEKMFEDEVMPLWHSSKPRVSSSAPA
jgi:hypothetical protein